MNILAKNWDVAISNYKKAIKFLPEKFHGHQKLIFALSEKCKEEYENCIEARNYIESTTSIFLERKNELEKYSTKLKKIEKENYK